MARRLTLAQIKTLTPTQLQAHEVAVTRVAGELSGEFQAVKARVASLDKSQNRAVLGAVGGTALFVGGLFAAPFATIPAAIVTICGGGLSMLSGFWGMEGELEYIELKGRLAAIDEEMKLWTEQAAWIGQVKP